MERNSRKKKKFDKTQRPSSLKERFRFGIDQVRCNVEVGGEYIPFKQSIGGHIETKDKFI